MIAKYERIAATVALVGLGLALLLTDISALGIPVPGPGGRLATLPVVWVIGCLLVIFAAGAADAMARTSPAINGERLPKFRILGISGPSTAILWIQPAVLTATALVIVPLLQQRLVQGVAVILFTAALFGILLAQQYITDHDSAYYSLSHLGLNVATYLVALAGYSAIYIWKLRSLLSGPVVALFTFLIMLDFLWKSGRSLRQVVTLSAVSGLVAAEAIWALNYWRATGFLGGTLLFFTFYILSGVLASYLLERLDRRELVEFGIVGSFGLLLIFIAALQRPVF